MYKKSLKERLPLACIIGAAFGLTFFFFSVLQSYAGNQGKFLFAIRDFIVPVAVIAVLAVIGAAALILFTGPKLGKWIAGGILGVTVMGYVQGAFLNTTHSLAGDDPNAFELEHANRIFNAAIWAAAALLFIAALIFVKNTETLRTAAVILSVAVIGMQLAGTVTSLLKASRSGQAKEYYLTTDAMTEVSPGKNIIVIILDRFDVMYYDEAVAQDPDFFKPLTGFTYYSDNISTYSRTYPGAAAIISGNKLAGGAEAKTPDIADGAEAYFTAMYGQSSFIKDLQANDYRIKLYMPGYYTYRSGSQLKDSLGAYNIAKADEYHITSRATLVKNMLRLSVYKALPRRLKPYVAVSTDSFNKIVAYDNGTLFEMDDYSICAQFRETKVTTDDSKGNYIYLHMGGCHDPYYMNENQERDWNGTMMGQLTGDMKMICAYFDQLKALGLYEDATIVITGDHPWARNDSHLPGDDEPRLTALFVKEAGRSDEPLAYSSAQVSQDNLAPTLVKSAGLATTTDYGRAYGEVPEGETVERYHFFEFDHENNTYLAPYKVTGAGSDFKNWHLEELILIGDLYK